jgi:Flp pilus assembly protein TadG
MLFFIMFAFPLLLLGGLLAGDVSQMITTSREVSNATEAAAVAGAFQFQGSSTLVDPNAARTAASNLIAQAESNGSIGVTIDSVSTIVEPNGFGSERVTVTTTYRLETFGFINMFNAFFGNDTEETTYTVTRTADVCIPGVSGYTPTGGSCTRPTTR